MRQDGHLVPSNKSIKLHHWQELLRLKTRSARRKYFTFLFKSEKKSENDAARKEKKRIEREQFLAEKQSNPKPKDDLEYGLGKNHILLRIRESTINQFYNHRLIQAMQFGQKLVVDCGYFKNMTTRENNNCAKQLMMLFSENRYHDGKNLII